MQCVACGGEIPAGARFCPGCGEAVASRQGSAGSARRDEVPGGGAEAKPVGPRDPTARADAAPTLASPAAGSPAYGRATPSDGSAYLDSDRAERYLPGAVIAGRYRVVGRLGLGGMGEVFRADDLKLGQPVALKFLTGELDTDPARLELLLDEVRVARRVAHPNVCRVYDVGEADGQHFISMEFVDGEDLETLLRRIGRLPRTKAAQIARQLCAGLAAAHEQGVLHRDLKPANVMIDGRGRARITDFGLARETEAVAGVEAGHGTPAYMSPEQLAGREATARSDLYALGLVLYELFTGRRPFTARSRADALDERSAGLPARPSSHVEGLDPGVEQAILACLEPDPPERPGSALAVAGALPGGDALAESLAAGETPSPEVVAAARTEGTVHPWLAAGAVAFCLLTTLGYLALEYARLVAPAGRPPLVLVDRAREILSELGYSSGEAGAGDEAWGYAINPAVARRVRQRPAEVPVLRRGGLPPVFPFWYRVAPSTLLARSRARVTPSDPPRGEPGSAMVTLDPDGRLVGLEAVPPRSLGEETPGGVGGAVLADSVLALAGLDPTGFEKVAPTALPPFYADERAAWIGSYPGGLEMRVEAATTGSRLSWLRIWSPELGDPEIRPEVLPELFVTLLLTLVVGLLVLGLWLARSNLRSGRGDRRGAMRLGLYVAVAWYAQWGIAATHRLVPDTVLRLLQTLAGALLLGLLTATFYIALEPALRRRWPHRIVSWTRVLSGRWRDPLVGRDLLLGATAVPVFLILPLAANEVGALFGIERSTILVQNLEPAGGGVPGVVHMWPTAAFAGPVFALGFMVMLLALTRLVRYEWIAAAIYAAVMALGIAVRDGMTEPVAILGVLLQFVPMVFVMLRFGLLAAVTLFGLVHLGLLYPVTHFTGPWYAGGKITLLATIPLVAAVGAWLCVRRTAPAADRPG